MELFEHWDRQLFLFLNGLHSPWMDEVMWMFSQQWFGVPFYLLFMWLFYKSHGIKGLIAGTSAAILTVALANTITSEILKEWTGRYRPTHNFEIGHLVHTVNDYRGGLYSFCSSHAANMFGIATITYLLTRRTYPKLVYVLIFWAAIISYSRIYLGVHYPSDVLAGALIGVGSAMLMFYMVKRYTKLLK